MVYIALIIFMLLLAMVVAFSPVLFATELAVITRSKNAYWNVFFLIAGILAAVLFLSSLFLLFIDPAKSFEIDLPSFRSVVIVAPLVNIVAGCVCILFALRIRSNLDKEVVIVKKPKKSKFSVEKLDSPGVLFWFGFFKMLLSITSVTAILLAVRYIKSSFDAGMLQWLLLLILVSASVLPFVYIAVLHKIKPDSFSKIQQTSDTIATLNYRIFFANLLFIFGTLLVAIGLFSRF